MLNAARQFLAMVVFSLVSLGAHAEGEFIDIYPKSEQEIRLVLDAVEERLASADTDQPPPIVLMLHGPEAARFLRSGYAQNKILVDQAAKLAGYGLIDVKICSTWLKKNKHDNTELFPFVSPVPFGQGELDRLQAEEGYKEFAVTL